MFIIFSICYVMLAYVFTKSCGMSADLNSVCKVTGNTMLCEQGIIPRNVSTEVKNVFFKNFDADNVNQIQLKDVSSIQTLDVEADKGKVIPQRSFEKFKRLTYLGLHGKQLTTIHKDAFLGLDTLVTLNLSSNLILFLDQVSGALNSENRTLLPNLKTLSVAKIKSQKASPIRLDNYFFRSISSGRNLKHLDLSELSINRISFRDIEPACKSLESLNLRNSVIGSVLYDFKNKFKACSSLRTVDASEIVVPALRVKASFESIYFSCKAITFYTRHVETVHLYKVYTEHNFEINGYLLDMSPCPFVLRKIDVSGNKVKWLNMTVRLHETTRKTLSVLNFSNDAIEYVSPSALRPSENLESLDFSHNKLNVMQERYRTEFESLFWAHQKLLYLNLSYNGLIQIPKNTFSENRLLKVLDISFNNIKILDFDVVHMVNLESLIARYNRIHTIQENTRKGFELLLTMNSGNFSDIRIKKSPVFVYLKGNKLICTCEKESVDLINWLHSAAVVDKSEEVTCKLSGKDVDIKQSAPKETEYFCTMEIVKKAATIVVPLVITITIVFVFIVVWIKRKQEKKEQILSVISKIKSGSFSVPHLVFLSYCSEDMDLVVNKIYPQLCECLARMTNSERQLVCLGDKHFRPGFALRYEVMRCVEESSVFIAVISKNFCHKHWCNLEVGLAHDQHKPIIMLMLEHVDKKLMDNFLKKIFDQYAHASWKPDSHGGHIEPDWKILCASIIQLAGKQYTG